MRKRSFSDCDLLFDGAMLHGGLGWREYIKRTGEHTWTVWYDPLDLWGSIPKQLLHCRMNLSRDTRRDLKEDHQPRLLIQNTLS